MVASRDPRSQLGRSGVAALRGGRLCIFLTSISKSKGQGISKFSEEDIVPRLALHANVDKSLILTIPHIAYRAINNNVETFKLPGTHKC